MANEMTAPALDLVQCPVCFKEFTAATINAHLDVCLLNSVTDGSPSTTDESEPPLKKSRIRAEALPPTPTVNKTVAGSSSMSGTPSTALFSLFQTNKSKVSVQSDQSGSFPSKQTTVTAANKGIKRNLPSEAEPGSADTESQPCGSNKRTFKSSNDLSPHALLTINKPLADILRPDTLEEYFGQSKVVGQQTLLRSLLDAHEIPSVILWGPPGCGKVSR